MAISIICLMSHTVACVIVLNMPKQHVAGTMSLNLNAIFLRHWLSTSSSVTLLLAAACLAALLLQSTFAGATPFRFVAVAAMTLLLVVLDRSVMRRYGETPPPPVAATAVGLHALLVEGMTLVDGLNYTAILYLTIPFPAFFLLGRRAGLLISGGLLAWFTLKFILFKPGWLQDAATMNTYLLFMISLVLIVAMAQVVQRERANRQQAEALLTDLEASHRQLTRYAEQVAELAKIEERNRLARDIHDSVGHYLTVIGVQLEKTLVVHEDDPASALEAVRAAKRLNDQALADVRQSVGLLRSQGAPFRLLPALESLLANSAGLPFRIDLTICGEEAGYTDQQLAALYRAAQEGLTNIQKHAHARQVTIMVELGEREAALHLCDDGMGFSGDPLRDGGFGLRGIQERLERVHGRLAITAASGGGTHLAVTIPRQPACAGE
jgi:signal transduction histidine kinase